MEGQLVDSCKKGCVEAQSQLYELFAPKMFTICLRYAPDRATAEDVLQDGFIKVFAKIGMFKGEGPLGAWIRRVMINTALEQLRKKQVLDKRHVDLDVCYEVSVAEDVFEKMTFAEVMEAIAKIPIGYREVLNLYSIDGYSHREIAQMLNISEGNSKQRLRRARNMLKQFFAETKEDNANGMVA